MRNLRLLILMLGTLWPLLQAAENADGITSQLQVYPAQISRYGVIFVSQTSTNGGTQKVELGAMLQPGRDGSTYKLVRDGVAISMQDLYDPRSESHPEGPAPMPEYVRPEQTYFNRFWCGLRLEPTPADNPAGPRYFPVAIFSQPGKYTLTFTGQGKAAAVEFTVTKEESVFKDVSLQLLLMGSREDLVARQKAAEAALLQKELNTHDKMCLLIALKRLDEARKSGLSDLEKSLKITYGEPLSGFSTPVQPKLPVAPTPLPALAPAPTGTEKTGLYLLPGGEIAPACRNLFRDLAAAATARKVDAIMALYDKAAARQAEVDLSHDADLWLDRVERFQAARTTLKITTLEKPTADDALPATMLNQDQAFQVAVVEVAAGGESQTLRFLVHQADGVYRLVRAPLQGNGTPLQHKMLETFDAAIQQSLDIKVLADVTGGGTREVRLCELVATAAGVPADQVAGVAVTAKLLRNGFMVHAHRDQPVYIFEVKCTAPAADGNVPAQTYTATMDLVFRIGPPGPKIVGLVVHDDHYDPQVLADGKFSAPPVGN